MCSVKLCQLNDNRRQSTHIFLSYFLFENLYPSTKMESQTIEFRAVIKFLTMEDVDAKRKLMCMVIVVQSIQKWQSGQQYLNVGETPWKRNQGQVALLMSPARRWSAVLKDVLNDRQIKVAELAS